MSSPKNEVSSIHFAGTWTQDLTGSFAVYDYDQIFSEYSGFVDIRNIVRRRWNLWSTELEDHYSDISKVFLAKSRWWWLTDSQRFNFLPSTAESALKPLLFARAVIEWLNNENFSKQNYRHQSLTIIGAPNVLRDHLSRLAPTSTDGNSLRSYRLVLTEIFEWFLILLKGIHVLDKAIAIFRQHVITHNPALSPNTLLLFSEAINGKPMDGFIYFFGSIEKAISEEFPDVEKICTSIDIQSRSRNKKASRIALDHIWLMDFLTTSDLFRALVWTAYFLPNLLITYLTYWTNRKDDRKDKFLLLRYLKQQLRISSIFENFCVYLAARRLLNLSKGGRAIFHYEEKSREKALCLACKEFEVDVTGYVVHPMGTALSALRDRPELARPLPDRYGVCGSAMVEFFSVWGRKPINNISLWGSGKTGELTRLKTEKLNWPLTVLLLPSFTMELTAAQKWLRSEHYFHNSFRFLIRRNSADLSEDWGHVLRELKKEFDFVDVIEGSLDEAFDRSDIVIYSSTSAGLLAGRHGLFSIYADWSDLYEVNAFLGCKGPPLQCRSANNLVTIIKEVCSADTDTLQNLYRQQQKFESKVFSPIYRENIRLSLSA